IALGRSDSAAVAHRLAGDGIVAVAIVADIDAQRRLCARLCQQMAGKEAGAGADIEDVTRLEAGNGTAERGRLRTVIPVPANVGAQNVLFLEVHQGFDGGECTTPSW